MTTTPTDKLRQWFEKCPDVVVAFSGGVDSSLVAYLARTFLGSERVTAIISASPSLKLSDLEAGKDFCHTHDIPLKVIETQELQNPNYAANPANRCYFCKHTLYTELFELAGEHWILNGTNADDLGDYRPGLEAAEEFRVRSPLSECGLDKEAVRTLALQFKLHCWDKPASPCMSSRIPYGQAVTLEKLKQIEAGEALLKRAGFPIARLRHFGEHARIEVPTDRIADLQKRRADLSAALQDIGFSQVVFDQEGFVSGKLNRAIL
jgi:uncharacterized protein